MNDVRFSEPVILKSPRGLPRKVASSFEALECLDQEWPKWARGRSWRAACRACRDALEGWRGARDVRRAFVKAAARAGIMARAGRPAKLSERSLPLVRPQEAAPRAWFSSAG
jgi:hypothetical protein